MNPLLHEGDTALLDDASHMTDDDHIDALAGGHRDEPAELVTAETDQDAVLAFVEEFGGSVNEATALEMFAFISAKIEKELAREIMRRELDHRRGVFASVYAFQGNRSFALECAIMAHGFTEILGVKDFTKLSERWRCEKENVRKLVKQIQEDNGLPTIPGQREKEGCKNMSNARKLQLNRGDAETRSENV